MSSIGHLATRPRRRSLVRAGADLRGRFSFDELLHRVFEDASQHVRVCALELIEQRLVRHPVLGNRGSPGDQGKRMPLNDSWIAATAIANRLPVVAQDDDYADIPGLEVIRI